MHVMTQYPDGLFCWVDLSTSDVAAAKAFYAAVFGWQAVDSLVDEQGNLQYAMFQLEGKNVAGLGPQPPDAPPMAYWTSYVKSSDVDSILAKVEPAGGQIIAPAMDIMAEGRMAILQDPTGAMVGIWQPQNHIGAQLVNYPNTLVWNELQTRDVAAGEAFYTELFGWEARVDPATNYMMLSQEGRVQAGIMGMDENWPPDTPTNWAVYFLVTDLATAVAQATAHGGTILVSPTSAGDMGHFAVIADPQGGVFTAMQIPLDKVDPPPGA
jgi:uncharacterized protein